MDSSEVGTSIGVAVCCRKVDGGGKEEMELETHKGTSGCSNSMERDKGKEKPPSRSNSDESIGTRPVSVTVVRDTGTKVQLMLKAHGMKKKKSFFGSILTVFKKPHTPSKLVENGRFTRFDLKDHSLGLTLEVQTNKKKKKSNENRVDTFVCDIKQFPTGINPDSAEFEILEPASGEAFIHMTLMKTDNLNINWKEFLDANGTIDVTAI